MRRLTRIYIFLTGGNIYISDHSGYIYEYAYLCHRGRVICSLIRSGSMRALGRGTEVS